MELLPLPKDDEFGPELRVMARASVRREPVRKIVDRSKPSANIEEEDGDED